MTALFGGNPGLMGVLLLLAVILAAVLLAGLARKGKKSAGAVQALPLSGQELFHQKCILEQNMARVVGGSTGLMMLLERVQNTADGDAALHRENCRRKQALLRGYMEEYQALLRQARALPEEERARFAPSEDLEQYRLLLEKTV